MTLHPTARTSLTNLRQRLQCVLLDGLDRVIHQSGWDVFERRAALDDLMGLTNGQDAYYDRPSSGFEYASWYHARRVHTAVRALAPVYATTSGPLTVVDLGAGTGAAAWALAALHSVSGPRQRPSAVTVVAIESSMPMVSVAESLWATLCGEAVLGRAARAIQVGQVTASWADLPPSGASSLGSDEPTERRVGFASYLVDASDAGRCAELGPLVQRCVDLYDLDRLVAVGPSSKRDSVRALGSSLERAGWTRNTSTALADPVWTGVLSEVGDLRRTYHRSSGRDSLVRRDPAWSTEERPGLFTWECAFGAARPEVSSGARVGTSFDREQTEAAEPDGRMTAIIGAAGSGKSRVLIERVVRTVAIVEAPRSPRRVLVTTFNKRLTRLLASWIEERLADEPNPWRACAQDGEYRFTDGRSQGSAIVVLHLDLVATRIVGERRPSSVGTISSDGVRRRLNALRIDRSELTAAQSDVLEAAFLTAELLRVIYGKGVWADRDQYLNVDRVGRGVRLSRQQRELVWELLMHDALASAGAPAAPDDPRRTWSHRRMLAAEKARRQLASRDEPAFTDVFVDECQDLTETDFEVLASLVADPSSLVVAGDETQSIHLGATYRRPGQVVVPPRAGRDERTPAFRRWNVHRLHGSYRLPARVCEAIAPLASSLAEGRVVDRSDHDVCLPEARKSAVLGLRPVVVAASNVDEAVNEVLVTHRRVLHVAGGEIRVTVGVEDPALVARLEEGLRVTGVSIVGDSMLWMKGLEVPCIVWPTSAVPPLHESSAEWIYTLLSRTTCLALIVVDPDRTSGEAADALRLIEQTGRLNVWDQAASAALAKVLAVDDPSRSGDASPSVNERSEPQARVLSLLAPSVRDAYPRSFLPWTPGEDEMALRLRSSGTHVEELARRLGRIPATVELRCLRLTGNDPGPVIRLPGDRW